MSYIKKRVSRKATAPQEILTDQKSLANWIRDNSNLIVYTVGGLLFVLFIYVGISWMKNQKNTAANEALSQALKLYKTSVTPYDLAMEGSEEQLLLALESLTEVAREYPDRPQGQSATLYRARILYLLGRYQESADTVEKLVARNREMVVSLNAYYLLARNYEALGDLTRAIETYQVARDHAAGDMTAVIDIDLARCYELTGDREKAITMYKSLRKAFPDTVFALRAEKKLATLGVLDQESL